MSENQMRWNALPARPWDECVRPSGAQLVAWFDKLSRDELIWVLDTVHDTWRADSDCFMQGHAERIRDLERDNAQLLSLIQQIPRLPWNSP